MGVLVRRTRVMIAHDVAKHFGLCEWERAELARLSHGTLLRIAQQVMPGYSTHAQTNG